MAGRRVRVLHISDVHMRSLDGPQAQRERLEAASRWRVLGEKWMTNLAELERDAPIDLVVFTGDLGDRGHPTDYPRALAFLKETCGALHVPLDRLFVIPGNHDIDRTIQPTVWESLRRDVAKAPRAYSTWLAGEDRGALRGDARRDQILERQQAFWAAVSDELGRSALMPQHSPHTRLGYRQTLAIPGLSAPIHVIGLDTAWLAGDENDGGNLRLTEHQLTLLTTAKTGEPLPGFRLALMHHRLADLADQADSRRLMANRVDLLLHGHQHEPASELLVGPDHQLLVLATGCLYEGDEGHHYPNAFQVIDLMLDDHARPVDAEVRFRGWSARGMFWGDDPLLYESARNGRLRLHRGARGWIFVDDSRLTQMPAREVVTEPPIASPLTGKTSSIDHLEPPQAVQDLWRRLRESTPSLPPSSIPTQGWRDVQPGASVVSKRQVLTGPGGSGKSYVLAQMHTETTGHRGWIDAQVTTGLEEALSFGAWMCSALREPLTLFVDALDAVTLPREFLSMIDRALAGRDVVVVVAARHTTWVEARDRLPSWEETPLDVWSTERVRQLAEKNRPDPLGEDLVELLRSPLLLDLFVRTFKPNEQLPAGLATRHGVLRSYFEHRVLPAAHRDTGQRRAALDRGASAILSNGDRWFDSSNAANDLVGEGVFVLTSGELAFRHALLRNFAVSLFLGRHGAVDIANRLKLVTNPAIRNDLMRGLLEARMDPTFADAPGPAVASLVRACASHQLAPGIALGSSDAPTAALVALIAPLESGTTFQQVLDRARLVDNRTWIRVLASIEGTRPSWLGGIQLEAISRLAEYARETRDPAAVSFARTLRRWTIGEAADTWAMGRILKLVVHALPDDETLAWIANLQMRAVVTTGHLLDELRHMLVSQSGLNADMGRRALTNLVFAPGTGDAVDRPGQRSLIRRCLLSNGPEKPGILSKRPEIALPIVFELGAREAEKQRRWRDEGDAKPRLREAFAKLIEGLPPLPRDLEETEANLKRIPILTEAEALGSLVDDAQWTFSHRLDDVGRLFNAVTNLAHEPASIPALVAAATASRSIRARLLILDRRSAADADAVREVLADPRIYHSASAQQMIHDAIAWHWNALPTGVREQIQRSILNVASSPLLRVTAVGHLATAIPRSELDPQLLPYLDFKEQEQRTMFPDVPSAEHDLPVERRSEDADRTPSGAKRNEIFARLQESIEALPSGEAQRVLAEIVERELLNEADPNTWFEISKVLAHDEAQASPSISGVCIRTIFDAALNRARSARGRELSFWTTLIDVADSACAHVELRADPAMYSALFEEIEAAGGQEATNQEHVKCALMFVRGWHWSRSDSPGRDLFLRWFKESLGAKGLEHGLNLLWCFDLATRIELVSHVMEATGRLPPADPDLRELANSIGRAVATWCMWSPTDAARDMFDKWRAERLGLLADDGVWRSLLDGFSWSLGYELGEAGTLQDDALKDAGVERFAFLANAAWEAWPPPADTAHDSIAWALLAPLESDFEGPARQWSYRLRSLLLSIVAGARRVDLLAALPGLQWGLLDEETLVAVVGAITQRAQRSGDDPQVVLELIEALEKTGSLRTLPVSMAYKVLDVLQALGGRFPRATTAANSVERRIRIDG